MCLFNKNVCRVHVPVQQEYAVSMCLFNKNNYVLCPCVCSTRMSAVSMCLFNKNMCHVHVPVQQECVAVVLSIHCSFNSFLYVYNPFKID